MKFYIIINYDNVMSGHLGITKTYHKIKMNYFRDTLLRDVKKYVSECAI